ncbi:hypothetical protein [Endozoicomonas arenosclerae]|uniref:hypothetical protein n=1 Tax=Endozoicomonas arenosclerae TaxID=1633495 RepID=UPI000781DE2C|nr:hypothetical protein [Endozoicomonas arenosclerae]
MDIGLEIVDKAIQRLVNSVAMLIAAGLLWKGFAQGKENSELIFCLTVALCMSALIYITLSLWVAMTKVARSELFWTSKLLVVLWLGPIYMVLGVAMLKIGLDNLQ